MTVSPEGLEAVWGNLALSPPPDRQFRSRRLDPTQSLDAHAGIRTLDEAPCILVDLRDPASATEEFEVGGMRLSRVAPDGGWLLVLSLEETSRRDMFAKVCADVLNAAAADTPSQALAQFLDRLDAWRLFLRELRPGFGREDIVGLLGELHVLQMILRIDSALLPTWRAPQQGLHDFEHRGHAIEVKSSLGPSAQMHISRLDQLDGAGLGRLSLVHVRLYEDPGGASLNDLIAETELLLPSETARQQFQNALLRRGLPPDGNRTPAGPRCRLQAMTAWRVDDGFPRLTRGALPAAIVEAQYQLDPRALTSWRDDATVTVSAFAGPA